MRFLRNIDFAKICQILHRVTGLLMLLFILISTLTGILLSHRERFSLYEKPVQNTIVLWLYGEPKVFYIGDEEIREDYPPSWERALTYFHGGRFRGRTIILMTDILAISLIILSLTGAYLYIKKAQLRRGIPVPERLEDLDYLQILDRFNKLKGKSIEIKDRINELHKMVEHMFTHTEDKGITIKGEELLSIEGHIRELDIKTHEIIEKMKEVSIKGIN